MKNNDARGAGMNAVEFVRKYGWKEANKASVSIFNGDVTYKREEINIDDLKRLVESWKLVESYGGVGNAKVELLKIKRHPMRGDYVMVSKAIRDVESVGGGV